MKILATFLSILFSISVLHAQDGDSPSPIYFIYDGSGSMWGPLEGKTKMEIGAAVLSETVDQLPENQSMGLVAYGHRRKSDCKDVEFLVDLGQGSKTNIKTALSGIKPLGKTPLAYAALQVIDTLRKSKEKATIILVTDGIESCGGNLCAVITAARKEGIAFRLHVVGFGLKDDETATLKCAAKAGDGNYYDANNTTDLSDALNEVTQLTVDEPASNVSLFALKNGLGVDAYLKAYDAGTQKFVAASRTYGDTAFFYLPPGNYNLEINPLEQSDIAPQKIYNLPVEIEKITHQTVSFDGGTISVEAMNNGLGWDALVNIYPAGEKKRAASGRTYGRADLYELDPGKYDVEIKALSMNGNAGVHRFEEVVVLANQIVPLNHEFKSGTVMIGATSDIGLVDATVNIYAISNNKNVASGRTYTTKNNNPKKFILTPGKYKVVLKALGSYKGKSETFIIDVPAAQLVEKIVSFQ